MSRDCAAAFRQAVEARDLEAIVGCFAADGVLRSPVSFKPFRGRDEVGRLLEIVLATFEDFHYTDELVSDGVRALIFSARVGEREVEGLDLLRFDADGQIEELTVMVRPLSGLVALAESVAPRLTAASG